ncbi:MAG: glycosyltransferase N-terminal domain-containing protein [Bacteroidota bacterium]|nr:glycosyltransferase N-terminal domain-containing protein [Bacteroidota bacterium]
MYKILYTIGIKLYYLLVLVASLFNKKAKLWINGRKNVFADLENFELKSTTNIWFHVSSLGEFEQARPLIEKIKQKHKDYRIILTFFSPSGFEIQKNYKFADVISYLPIDSRKNAKKFISLLNPKMTFFVKYDFWFYYLKELKRNKINTFLVSGIFLKNQMFFKSIGKWYADMLRLFTKFFVQNKESLDLLNSINIDNVLIAGDTRFDRVIEIAESLSENQVVEDFVGDKKCIIAGSTWFQDEQLLSQYINNSDNIKFIIAPHEIHENHIINLLQIINRPVIRYSRAEGTDLKDYQVMIIDNMGMLASIYKYGDVAYIGGGFGAGIHNIVEAAVYGMPIVFGTEYSKFKEAKDMIELKSAFSISDFNELKVNFDLFISDENYLETVSEKAKDYVMKNKGASDIILNEVMSDYMHL